MNGSELKRTRESRLGATQAELADRLGVSPNTVARWERDEIPIPATAKKLLQHFAEDAERNLKLQPVQGIARDDLHEDILRRLQGKLDPRCFEACVADLLRPLHPTLVPIGGVQDDGYDGRESDGVMPAAQIVVTTQAKPSRNLEKSLQSARNKGHLDRRAIFATSQPLSQRDRKVLADIAADHDTTLVQCYDRAALANLLYPNPEWTLKLLGLTGRPEALSATPNSSRPSLNGSLIGRGDELRTLVEATGHCIVVGTPGSGKTQLLRFLQQELGARFVLDADVEAIASGFRKHHPRVLMVDDAHVHQDKVKATLRVAEQHGYDVRLVLATWPSTVGTVEDLFVGQNISQLYLERLSGEDIVAVMKDCGLNGPAPLHSSIAEQAQGRPGAAATLASLCLSSGVNKVLSGEALMKDLSPLLKDSLGKAFAPTLAMVALGGSGGMRLSDVSQVMGESEWKLQRALSELASAGVLVDHGDDIMSVWPEPLRWQLVRDQLIDQRNTSRLRKRLLERAPSMRASAEVLLGAAFLGSEVEGLENIVFETGDSELINRFARLGRRQAAQVMKRYSADLVSVADGLLDVIPEEVIPPLLDQSTEGDVRTIEQSSAFQKLRDWATQCSPYYFDVTARRSVLIAATLQWASRTGHVGVALPLLAAAMSPDWSSTEPVPGTRRSFVMSSGFLPPATLTKLGTYWRDYMNLLEGKKGDPFAWNLTYRLVNSWIDRRPDQQVPEASAQILAQTARTMIADLLEFATDQPGVARRLRDLGEALSMEIAVDEPEDLTLLYPPGRLLRSSEDYEAAWERVRDAADRWVAMDVHDMARRVEWMEREYEFMQHSGDRLIPELMYHLAPKRSEPLADARVLIDNDVQSELIRPFLAAGLDKSSSDGSALLEECLGKEPYRTIATEVAITGVGVSPAVLKRVVGQERPPLQAVNVACLRGQVPLDTLRFLLEASNREIAYAAATGSWRSKESRVSEPTIREAWETAILDTACRDIDDSLMDYQLTELLKAESDLAKRWIVNLASSDIEYLRYEVRSLLESVLPTLPLSSREHLLRDFGHTYVIQDVIAKLVGGEEALYRTLLSIGNLAQFHLWPLRDLPVPECGRMVSLAVGAGYSPLEVADALYPRRMSWSGNESAVWEARMQEFEQLAKDPDPRVESVAKLSIETCERRMKACIEDERYEEVTGQIRTRGPRYY